MSEVERLFDDWKNKAAEADILQEAQRCGAKLKRAGKEWVGPCPACGGKDRFSINIQKRVFNCRGAGGGGVVSMVMHVMGLDYLGACQQITGEPPPRGRSRELSEEEREARRRRREENERKAEQQKQAQRAKDERRAHTAAEIWEQCAPIAGTIAEKYLLNRGIPVPKNGWPDVLGFHPALDYELDGAPHERRLMPALVGRVQDVSHETVAIWQIYLTPTGAKAKVENVKLGRGPAAGGAVRIGGDGPHIGVAEGIETALMIWVVIIRCRYPVWSCMDAGKMQRFEPPLFVKRVTIYPDGDLCKRRDTGEIDPPRGMRAARVLYDRMAEAQIDSSIVKPPNNADFLDVGLTVLAFEGKDGQGPDD